MKRSRKYSGIFAALLTLGVATASAHDFEVDGIYYNYNENDTSVAVTFKGQSYDSYSDEYSGEVLIPAEVTFSGKTYTVTTIGKDAFRKCFGLTAVEIPNTVTSIDYGAFYATSLRTMKIPESVKSIGVYAFACCDHLTSVEIPASVTKINKNIFTTCHKLSSIVVDTENKVYDSRENCNAIIETECNKLVCGCKTTVIPNTVTVVGFGAFEGCSDMVTMDIPSSVTLIEGYVFHLCKNLTTVFYNAKNCSEETYGVYYDCDKAITFVIGEDVEKIGPFVLCAASGGVQKIVMHSSTPPEISSYTFPKDLGVLYVPKGSADNYRWAEVWSEFSDIREIGSPVDDVVIKKVAENHDNGTTIQLVATVAPSNATLKDIYWSSENKEVATVDQSGKVTVFRPGEATISAMAIDGSGVKGTYKLMFTPESVEENVDDGEVMVRGENGVIRIEGAEGAAVEVYNAAGVCVFNGTATEVPVPQRGIYVVRVSGRVTKIIL